MKLTVSITDEEGNAVGHEIHFAAPLVLESTREELEQRMLRDILWAAERLHYRYLGKRKDSKKTVYGRSYTEKLLDK